MLGQDELSGKEIYSIYQDKKFNYWIGTNYGIYKYDGYNFKFLTCPEMLSPSVFNLSEDSKGRIYCHNLGGQLFRIENDSCSLYFQIPDEILFSHNQFAIDKNDNIYFTADNLYRLDKKNKSFNIVIPFEKGVHNCYFFNNKKQELHFIKYQTIQDSDFIVIKRIDKEEPVEKTYMFEKGAEKLGSFTPFEVNESMFIFSENTGSFFRLEDDKIIKFKQIATSDKFKVILPSEQLWISNLSDEIYSLDKYISLKNNYNDLLRKYAISTGAKDNEGNILLGTFNSGVIVIPKTQVYDIYTQPKDGIITNMTIGPDKTILYATNKGIIIQLKSGKEIARFNTNTKGQIEFLHYMKNSNDILFYQKTSFKINVNTKQNKVAYLASLKNISEVYPNEYLLSSNIGVHYFSDSKHNLFPKNNIINTEASDKNYFRLFNGRSTSACYDTIFNILYVGASTGLQITDSTGFTTPFKINGKIVYANGFLFKNGLVYVTTNQNGLLIFENGKLVDNWYENDNKTSSVLKHIRSWGDYLLVSSEKGIRLFEASGKSKRLINKSEGLYSNQINKFEILNDTLWLLHPKGIQTVALNIFRPSNFKPSITIKKILVNDIAIKTDSTGENEFNYFENKITFEVSSHSLRYQDGITYWYRLIGVDEDWQNNTHEENKISYKTLPPNKYTFEIESDYNGNRSKRKSFSFEIHPPFWDTWWFISLVIAVIVFSSIFILVYVVRRHLRKIHYKNEINGLKLTAIQAQMNPHFIFNSLNSIQDLVLKNDAENAYTYISKFALLVRNTLNHSNSDFIPLETEIQSLELYLSLEKMRFKKNFAYTIINTIEDQLQLPPLLIQPFVENAIVHGLIHKEGEKKVDITFNFNEELICIIKDNGIGRKHSKEINARQNQSHKSFAVKAIKKRLEILEDHYGGNFEIVYDDIDSNGETGTKLTIHIPHMTNY